MDAAFERSERLRGVEVVRRAHVQHVDLVLLEQLVQVVVRLAQAEVGGTLGRATRDRDDLDPDRVQRDRMNAGDEPGAHDGRAHQREARNIFVSTSMSSRAASGGVRHGVPSAMHEWKCRSSRENASS